MHCACEKRLEKEIIHRSRCWNTAFAASKVDINMFLQMNNDLQVRRYAPRIRAGGNFLLHYHHTPSSKVTEVVACLMSRKTERVDPTFSKMNLERRSALHAKMACLWCVGRVLTAVEILLV